MARGIRGIKGKKQGLSLKDSKNHRGQPLLSSADRCLNFLVKNRVRQMSDAGRGESGICLRLPLAGQQGNGGAVIGEALAADLVRVGDDDEGVFIL